MDENDLNALKYIFSYLVDSFSYEVERDKKAAEIENTEQQLENDRKSIDVMKNSIIENVDAFVSSYNDFKPYKEKLMNSVTSLTDQFFTVHSQDTNSKMSELKQDAEKDIENGIRAMNQFLSLNPLTVLNTSIEISLQSDKFEIKQSTRCSYEISYVFGFDPQNSQFMKNPYFSSLYAGIKIPVSVEADNNIIYENMDSYKLSGAKLSRNTLNCIFINETSGNSVEFTYKISGPDMEIIFTDNNKKNKIMDNPDLIAHLDRKILSDALDKFLKEIMALTSKDGQLLSLMVDNEETLNTMEFGKIFYKIIESDYIKSLVKSLPEATENPDDISLEFIRHRVHTIGKDEDYIISTLLG